jgi:Mg/Co/Ni transporter MgtE
MSKRTTEIASGAVREIEPELRELFTKVVERDPREAVKMLEPYPDEFVVKMLELLNPAATLKILQRFDLSRRETILATASSETTQQWMRNQTYPERTVGRLMQPPLAVFRPTTTVAEATEQIRRLAKKTIITYAFVTDEQEKLLGVVVMRDMLLAQQTQRLDEIMLKGSVPSDAQYVADRGDESCAGSALSSLSRVRKIRATHRPGARSDAF